MPDRTKGGAAAGGRVKRNGGRCCGSQNRSTIGNAGEKRTEKRGFKTRKKPVEKKKKQFQRVEPEGSRSSRQKSPHKGMVANRKREKRNGIRHSARSWVALESAKFRRRRSTIERGGSKTTF